MTNEELKAAAERLLSKVGYANGLHDFVRDFKGVARAFLSRLAAEREDAEPITEEWLLSNGFIDDGDEERWNSGIDFGNCVVSNHTGICIWYFSGSHTSIIRTDIHTIGQLRRLLEALKGGA